MCGIAGEIRWDGQAADARAVAVMSDVLARRGPDYSGLRASGPVALGHRRLEVIDPSPLGDTPGDVDPVSLHHYMTLHGIVPAPRTILAAVEKLPAATVRVIERDGTTRSRTYWDPPFERTDDEAAMSGHEWQEAVLDSL